VPRLAGVVGFEGDDSVWRKVGARLSARHEEREQPRQMRKVPGDRDVSRFPAKTIAKPLGRIVGLQVA